MLRLSDLLKEVMESAAADQAKAMGLVSIGFGRWKDPRTNQVTHITKAGQLIPVEPIRISQTRQQLKGRSDERPRGDEYGYDSFDWDTSPIYGPAPTDAPDPTEDLEAGIYRREIIRGRLADVDMDSDIFFRRLIPTMSVASSLDYSEEAYASIKDSIDRAIEAESVRPVQPLGNLCAWMSEEDVHSKKDFMEAIIHAVPARIEVGQPLLRGLSVKKDYFNEFMEDFAVGNEFTFPEPYSFTTDSHTAKQFTFGGALLDVPVVFRLHAANDGKTSAIDVQGAARMYRKALPAEFWDVPGDDDPASRIFSTIDEWLDFIEPYDHEEEMLTIPGTRYKVMGMLRNDGDMAGKILVIDIQEVVPQEVATTPQPINKIAQKLFNAPLVSKRRKKHAKTR